MKVTIIVPEKAIGIGDTIISGITTSMSWIPSNVHAVHWDDSTSTGHVEYNDGTLNTTLSEIGIYSQAETTFNNELKIEQEEIQAIEDAKDWSAILRARRNAKLYRCDWTRMDDNGLSTSKKNEWATYRQTLRDLPANTSDPRNPTWPSEPS